MKKLLLILFCICFIFALGFVGGMDYADEVQYVRNAVIVDNGEAEDAEGYIWGFEADGYEVGEKVELLMNSKGTEDIFDDEIVKIERR